ncbi:hypothetical protein, partial [Bosea sp. Root483D1]|uniref:hypothetical protein n=1 Tax=Bosea sp. Root483D1 TaxID=1736544 RepID=UPI001AECDD83
TLFLTMPAQGRKNGVALGGFRAKRKLEGAETIARPFWNGIASTISGTLLERARKARRSPRLPAAL